MVYPKIALFWGAEKNRVPYMAYTALCSVHIRSVHMANFPNGVHEGANFNRKCVQLVKCESKVTNVTSQQHSVLGVWTVTRTVAKRSSKTRAATCDVTVEDAFTVLQ